MPQIRHDYWQLGLLIFCVPLQYYVVQNWSSNETSRSFALKQLLRNLVNFHENYLKWKPWKQWCLDLLIRFREQKDSFTDKYTDNLDDPMGESPAVEVMKYKQKEGYFSTSPEPRNPRNPSVKYRIGQVVQHKAWKYRGVITGWDESARAPEKWLDEMHGKNSEWRKMPNYAIAVDVRDRLSPQITYVPEENLEVIKHKKVMHPLLDEYFENFDGAQYIPRPWLRAVYPRD